MKIKQNKTGLEREISLGRFGLEQRAIFAKNLSVMIKSGLTIAEALRIIENSSKGKVSKVAQGILASVEAGNSLSSSLERFIEDFSPFFVNVVRAGEKAGTLEENLESLANQLDKEKKLLDKIKSAMIYPAVVLAASFLLGLAMAFLVLPKITPLFEGLRMDLPITTRALIWLSKLIRDRGLEVVSLSLGGIFLFFWVIRRKIFRPAIDRIVLKIPLAKKLIKGINLNRFCVTLATSIKSGLTIPEALEAAQGVLTNHHYRKAVSLIKEDVNKGIFISRYMEKNEEIFPLMFVRMVKVGEESGRLEETFNFLSVYYEEEVNNVTKSLVTLIEPMLLLFIGLVVLFLALSIITPIYNITGNIAG